MILLTSSIKNQTVYKYWPLVAMKGTLDTSTEL